MEINTDNVEDSEFVGISEFCTTFMSVALKVILGKETLRIMTDQPEGRVLVKEMTFELTQKVTELYNEKKFNPSYYSIDGCLKPQNNKFLNILQKEAFGVIFTEKELATHPHAELKRMQRDITEELRSLSQSSRDIANPR